MILNISPDNFQQLGNKHLMYALASSLATFNHRQSDLFIWHFSSGMTSVIGSQVKTCNCIYAVQNFFSTRLYRRIWL